MQHLKEASRARNIWFRFLMGAGIVGCTPILMITDWFVAPDERQERWRRAGAAVCRFAFRCTGIRLHLVGREHLPSGPALYAANHGSPLDGFMMSALLGPRMVVFSAPLQVFPRPVALWMRNMGTIDVRRDMFDDARYPRGESKAQAFKRIAQALERGESLIIFPEGHIEYLHVLHYFHTGVARMSALTHVPVVPVGIVGAAEVFPDEHHTRAGTVVVRIDRPLRIPEEGALTNRAEMRRLRDTLERRLIAMLPLRYLPPYYHAKQPKRIGVFVDIDHTMYEGITLVDFVWFLIGLHRTHASDLMRMFYWLFLERTHVVSHREMMRHELARLRGWDVGELRHLAERAFQERMVPRVNYHLFSMLKDHAERGHAMVLVTETIHPLAQAFRRAFGARASFDTELATEVRHGKRCYTGAIRCLCYHEKKAELVRQFAERAGIDLEQSYGYGDSIHDVPFLSLVGHPVAVHPDRGLLKIAEEHGWSVLDKR